jgi:four helix bundle protein
MAVIERWVDAPGRHQGQEANVPISHYRDLVVWRKGVNLAVECYRITERLPGHERFGLTAQVRSAAVSIPANIAEGHGRSHRGDYTRHLSIAKGSAMELETHLLLLERLGYIDCASLVTARRELDEISRMLTALIRALTR